MQDKRIQLLCAFFQTPIEDRKAITYDLYLKRIEKILEIRSEKDKNTQYRTVASYYTSFSEITKILPATTDPAYDVSEFLHVLGSNPFLLSGFSYNCITALMKTFQEIVLQYKSYLFGLTIQTTLISAYIKQNPNAHSLLKDKNNKLTFQLKDYAGFNKACIRAPWEHWKNIGFFGSFSNQVFKIKPTFQTEKYTQGNSDAYATKFLTKIKRQVVENVIKTQEADALFYQKFLSNDTK